VAVEVELMEVVGVLVGAMEEVMVAMVEAEVEAMVVLGPMWQQLRTLSITLMGEQVKQWEQW
jgi:hypothetical protein